MTVNGYPPRINTTVEDDWYCTCGNRTGTDGFGTSIDGVEVEPIADGPWVDEYVCRRCGATVRMPGAVAERHEYSSGTPFWIAICRECGSVLNSGHHFRTKDAAQWFVDDHNRKQHGTAS